MLARRKFFQALNGNNKINLCYQGQLFQRKKICESFQRYVDADKGTNFLALNDKNGIFRKGYSNVSVMEFAGKSVGTLKIYPIRISVGFQAQTFQTPWYL